MTLKERGEHVSYLLSPRINFAGRFVSDVSTLNNLDQDKSGDWVPGWNAAGTGAFDLVKCAVTGLRHADETPTAGGAQDPCLDYVLVANHVQPCAKMVDLDPSWQLASELWGLSLSLVDPLSGEAALTGDYHVASFRDLWTRQLRESAEGRLVNGQPSGARYVSTLENVTFGPAAQRSPLLAQLRAATSGDKLAIGFHQFGYFYTQNHPRYRTGALIGSIGPSLPGEPSTAVVSRRMQAAVVDPKNGIAAPSDIDFEVAPDESHLSLDLGHALPIDNPDGDISDIGKLALVPQLRGCVGLALAAKTADFAAFQPSSEALRLLAEFNEPFTSPQWYKQTGGIVDVALKRSDADTIREQPLALYGRMDDGSLIAISCETDNGIFVRADTFTRRLDPTDESTVTFHARKYGRPAADIPIYLSPPVVPRFPPATPDYFDGAVTALHLDQQTILTGADGTAAVKLRASDPGQPRRLIDGKTHPVDGQVYKVAYSPAGSPSAPDRNGTGLSDFDVVVSHVRGHVEVPDTPDWDADVRPILADYALLYPVMSRHLFDISDHAAVANHHAQMQLAFSRPIEDPDYMPVTRDMSRARRQIIVNWLRTPRAQHVRPAHAEPRQPAPTPSAPVAADPEMGVFDAKRDAPRLGPDGSGRHYEGGE
jgi:hypothetical protein